jgi:hypothetical protein
MPYVLPHVDDFGDAFHEALPLGWEVAIAGRERFGSWEWNAWNWPDRRRPRAWVILAITPTESSDGRASRAVIDVWAASEIHERYRRERLSAVELELMDELSGEGRELIRMQVATTAAHAAQLRAADIGDTYAPLELIQPRPLGLTELRVPTIERGLLEGAGQLQSDWLGPLRGRAEVSLSEASSMLEQPVSRILELALQDVRDGRLRVVQRNREIYLVAPGSG